MIVGNKCDMKDLRVVPHQHGLEVKYDNFLDHL
jgi:hypothetical protein